MSKWLLKRSECIRELEDYYQIMTNAFENNKIAPGAW
jgi:hypothetical protein